MSSVATINQAEIFSRAIDSHADLLTPEVAQYFLALELTEDDTDRLNNLAEKSRQGTLSDEESVQLDEYRRLGRLVELMRLKARIVLQSS